MSRQAAAERYGDEALLKRDLGHLPRELKARQEQLIRQASARPAPAEPVMTEREREDALALLRDLQLLARLLKDYEACGLVGEEINKLVCYLACTSRLLDRPLVVLVQSGSAAGKTTLQDAVLRFMPPPEAQWRLSTIPAQSLYYLPRAGLRHKILAVAEEDGLLLATCALKLLPSNGRLSIVWVGRDTRATRHAALILDVLSILSTRSSHVDHRRLGRPRPAAGVLEAVGLGRGARWWPHVADDLRAP